MIIRQIVVAFIGVAAGFLVAAGVFAFAVMIGVVTRIIARTRTTKYLGIIEDSIVAGGTIGSVVSVFRPELPVGGWLLAVYGLFSGIHAGCLAIALAETVNVIPVFARRIRLKFGLAVVVTSFALGKAFGVLWEMVLHV